MNVLLALLIVAVAAALGGVGHGVLTYGGAVMPKMETHQVTVGPDGSQRTVPVTLWLPGVVGEAFFGVLTGVVVFCIYTTPTTLITLKGSYDLTFYAVGTALIAGLGGSVAISTISSRRSSGPSWPLFSRRAIRPPRRAQHQAANPSRRSACSRTEQQPRFTRNTSPWQSEVFFFWRLFRIRFLTH